MKVFVLEKKYVSHDCWGCYYDDWVRTDIIFTNEEEIKQYIKGNDNYRYATIEAR